MRIDETATIIRRPPDNQPSVFIASESLTLDELVGLWNTVSLTPAESLVLKALQLIDPEIERIAVQVATANSYYCSGSRGGFIAKRRTAGESPITGTGGAGFPFTARSSPGRGIAAMGIGAPRFFGVVS